MEGDTVVTPESEIVIQIIHDSTYRKSLKETRGSYCILKASSAGLIHKNEKVSPGS